MKSALLTLLALSTVTAFFAQGAALAEEKPSSVLHGKLTPWEAIEIATKKINGRPIQANYEFDDGKWIYGVIIRTVSGIQEVDVDPLTGELGAIETLTPEEESQEVLEEMQAALKAK